MRRNETRHQFGWSHGPRGSQGPSGIPPGHPRRWFRFDAILWSTAKEKGRNGAKPEPATGMAGADARGALGTAGAMGRAELMMGFVAPHSTSALGQFVSCVRPTSADSDTQ